MPLSWQIRNKDSTLKSSIIKSIFEFKSFTIKSIKTTIKFDFKNLINKVNVTLKLTNFKEKRKNIDAYFIITLSKKIKIEKNKSFDRVSISFN